MAAAKHYVQLFKEGEKMRKLIFLFIIFFPAISLNSQVSFELDFNFEKVNTDDELVNLQLFDYDNDGNDEILGSFNNQDYYRIVCYSQNGDTLNTHAQPLNNDESLGNSCAFYGQNNEKMLILVFHEYLGIGFKLKLFNYETFAMIDSVAYDIGYSYHVEGVNHIIAPNINDENIFYVGIDRFYFGYEEIINTITYKFDFSNEQIEFLEEVIDYGSYFIKYSDNDFIIASGEYVAAGIGAWPYEDRYFYLGLISNDYISNIQQVFSTSGSVVWSEPTEFNHYPSNYKIISINDNNYQNYGMMIYYKSTDSSNGVIKHFKCFDSDFSSLLWEQNDSNIGISNISTSTCISVNSENHYVMYFRGNQLEIRNRIDGDIIHHQNTSISPFKIDRKSDDELLFFVEQEDETGYDVYIIDGEIQVSVNGNQIEIMNYNLHNSPNPFNPTTLIEFSIQQKSEIELSVYNIKGQKIKTLTHGEFSKGDHSIIWNGDDEVGNSVSSEIYFYKLNVNGKTEAVKKCLFLK